MNLAPELRYDPEVDDFGSRYLETETRRRITFEEAFENPDYVDIVDRALQIPAIDVPMEFTMYILRRMAVAEKDFRSFEKEIPCKAREYLSRLIRSNRAIPRDIHRCYNERHSRCCNAKQPPSTFRGVFTKVFCKKVLANSQNLEDQHYEKLATIFPFRVSRADVMDQYKYKIDVLGVLDPDFYNEIQWFLNQHFVNVNARDICELFLNNIHHCMATTFPIDQLLLRKENIANTVHQNVDYLSLFPRLNDEGIRWFEFLYREFTNVAKCFKIRSFMFFERNDPEYFQNLPENNFVDLYSFLESTFYFQEHRLLYTHRFKKYLFFFIHALEVDPNPVFFIDDMLFECLKSLRRYKTLHEDIDMVRDFAKISLLHSRYNPERGGSAGKYYMCRTSLLKIKDYLTESVISGNPRLNVKYKTDLLTWMPYRTDDTCFNICYSGTGMYCIKDFFKRVLCSVLCPDEDPVKYIVSYNAFYGTEVRYEILPEEKESIRNFIRLCNTYDVSDESLEDPNDDFLKNFIPVIETERKVDQYIYAHFGLFDEFEGMIDNRSH